MTTPHTKNESLPELPVAPGHLFLHNQGGVSQIHGYTAKQMFAFYQQGYEAALTREAPTEGVAWHGRYKWSSGWSGWLLFTNKKAAEDFAGEYEFEIRPLYATPPAPQRLAQGEPDARCQCGWGDVDHLREECTPPTQPPHHDRGGGH